MEVICMIKEGNASMFFCDRCMRRHSRESKIGKMHAWNEIVYCPFCNTEHVLMILQRTGKCKYCDTPFPFHSDELAKGDTK